MTNAMDLAARLDELERPRREAERQAGLARLQGEAAVAQHRLAEIADELAVLAARRRELAPRIAEAEATFNALRGEDAHLAIEETSLQRRQGLCWAAIRAAELAGRPAVAPVPPRRWIGDAFDAALKAVFGLSLAPRRKAAAARRGPALRPGETEGVRVRFTAPTIAGGVSYQVGDEAVVSVGDVEILEGAGKVEVLERGVVVPAPRPFAIRNIGPTPVAVDGATVAPGAVAMVTEPTWAGVCAGAYPSLGPADPEARRLADLSRRAAELGVE